MTKSIRVDYQIIRDDRVIDDSFIEVEASTDYLIDALNLLSDQDLACSDDEIIDSLDLLRSAIISRMRGTDDDEIVYDFEGELIPSDQISIYRVRIDYPDHRDIRLSREQLDYLDFEISQIR